MTAPAQQLYDVKRSMRGYAAIHAQRNSEWSGSMPAHSALSKWPSEKAFNVGEGHHAGDNMEEGIGE